MGRSRSVSGVGLNDADYSVTPFIDGKRTICPFYSVWQSMLERCYNPKVHAKWPKYSGCSVAEEWLSFMRFRLWMSCQDWEGNQLDKDILIPGNKIYSADTCVFVDGKTNSLITGHDSTRGDFPIGVSKNGKKFQAYCNKDGRQVKLGTHPSQEEAHSAYKKYKAAVITGAAMLQPDERVKKALILRAYNLHH